MINLKEALAPEKLAPITFQRLYARLKGERIFPPHSVEIQPTSACNFNCYYCSYKKRNKTKCSLSLYELCTSIIKLRVKGVYLSGGGEPLLHPEAEDVLYSLKNAGISIGLITNGYFLRDLKNADSLDYIQMSLHGVAGADFILNTGVDGFKRCLGMAKYIKKKYGNNAPTIGAHVILTDTNIKYALPLLKKIKEVGFDYAKFKLVLDIENRGIELDPFAKHVKNLREKGNSGLNDPTFTNLFATFLEYKSDTEKCWSIDLNLLANIDPSGEVYLCICDIGNKDLSIGNIRKKPLEKIWGSKRHLEVIAKLQERYKSGNCSNCRFLHSNYTMQKVADSMPKSLTHQEFI